MACSGSGQLIHCLFRPAIIQILRAAGFHGARPSVVDTITELAARYLMVLATATATHAEQSREDEGVIAYAYATLFGDGKDEASCEPGRLPLGLGLTLAAPPAPPTTASRPGRHLTPNAGQPSSSRPDSDPGLGPSPDAELREIAGAQSILLSGSARPDVCDVWLAMRENAVFAPTTTATEDAWREALRRPLHEIPQRNGLRAHEAKKRFNEDVKDIRGFISWVKADQNAEIARIARVHGKNQQPQAPHPHHPTNATGAAGARTAQVANPGMPKASTSSHSLTSSSATGFGKSSSSGPGGSSVAGFGPGPGLIPGFGSQYGQGSELLPATEPTTFSGGANKAQGVLGLPAGVGASALSGSSDKRDLGDLGASGTEESSEPLDYVAALKRKHSKPGEEEYSFQGTVIGIPAEDKEIVIEGGPVGSLAEWNTYVHRKAANQAAAAKAAQEEKARAEQVEKEGNAPGPIGSNGRAGEGMHIPEDQDAMEGVQPAPGGETRGEAHEEDYKNSRGDGQVGGNGVESESGDEDGKDHDNDVKMPDAVGARPARRERGVSSQIRLKKLARKPGNERGEGAEREETGEGQEEAEAEEKEEEEEDEEIEVVEEDEDEAGEREEGGAEEEEEEAEVAGQEEARTEEDEEAAKQKVLGRHRAPERQARAEPPEHVPRPRVRVSEGRDKEADSAVGWPAQTASSGSSGTTNLPAGSPPGPKKPGRPSLGRARRTSRTGPPKAGRKSGGGGGSGSGSSGGLGRGGGTPLRGGKIPGGGSGSGSGSSAGAPQPPSSAAAPSNTHPRIVIPRVDDRSSRVGKRPPGPKPGARRLTAGGGASQPAHSAAAPGGARPSRGAPGPQ